MSDLEKKLANRPTPKKMKESGHFVSSNASHKLHAAMSDLQKAQTADKLSGSLRKRPSQKDLVNRGLLKKESTKNVHARILQGGEALQRKMTEDSLSKHLRSRSSLAQLHDAGIVNASEHYQEAHQVHKEQDANHRFDLEG
eukprot:g4654.t1